MDHIPFIENAYLIIQDGLIHEYGPSENLDQEQHFDEEIDVENGLVMPSFIDSHTHLVHAATREDEFVQRIQGKTYAEIAAAGGGILNSAHKLSLMSEDDLYTQAYTRLQDAIKNGTGAIEIKSGYGLSVDSELKMLRVIQRLKETSSIPIKSTFLGAHAFPLEFKENHQGYLRMIIDEMLPRIAVEKLADYIDVFCEEGFFNIAETQEILEAGYKYGLKAKIHANQLAASGGVELGVKMNALSVDHLECMNENAIAALQKSNTIPVLLPGAAFFLGMHYQPARVMLNAGLPLVLASDYNPGSCPSYNMSFILSLACTQMKMTPAEAINSVTVNAARALEIEQEQGIIRKGMKARLLIYNGIQSESLIPYWFGGSLISRVIV
jgi:imidazolonepropionase